MKKEGAGKGNWGTSADAAGAEDADEAAGKADAKDEAADGEEENGEPAEPEVNTVSYEDFLKEQEAKKAALNTKKAVTTVEETFDGMKAAGKAQTEGEDFFVGAGAKTKAGKSSKSQRAQQKNTNIEVGFRAPAIERPERESRYGEGRGGGRGRGAGGRGAGRGTRAPRERNAAPVDLSADAFPSLGGN